MLDIGPLVFTAPWLLTALAVLPILWWLLRVTPPSPLIRAFPPLSFLLALRPQEETPARTPLWLILLRILIAALIIVGLAHPLWNPGDRLYGNGPLIVVIDDDWSAAPGWTRRIDALSALIDQADRDGRPVRILKTAPDAAGIAPQLGQLTRPSAARQLLRGMKPKPWPTDRAGTLKALQGLKLESSAHIAWLSNGLDGPGARLLMVRLQQLGALTIYREAALARLIDGPRTTRKGLSVPVRRAGREGDAKAKLRLIDEDGRLLGAREISFNDGKTDASVEFDLPADIRNRAARIEIEGENGAGAVFLMDERWRRRPVGIAKGGLTEDNQPLLSDDYYLRRALAPFSDIHTGQINELINKKLAMIVLADIGKVSNSETEKLDRWIKNGGVLLRFAGPRMAKGRDSLVPVQLRGGGREIGGAMSWTTPAKLLPFGENSPFVGIHVPDDVVIRRQVLAEPTLALNSKTWARLSDGTPLVTGERRGNGWLALIHTTANTDWSNLVISGLFIEMLQRFAGLSQGISGDNGRITYPPLQLLDGFGVLGAPGASTVAIAGGEFTKAQPTPRTPPGYYGKGQSRRALNLSPAIENFTPFDKFPTGVAVGDYNLQPGFDAKPWLLLAAFLLLLADLIISYVLRGLAAFSGGRRAAATSAILLVCVTAFAVAASPAFAQTPSFGPPPSPDLGPRIQSIKPSDLEEAFAFRATLQTRLAYVITGNRQTDATSHAGLTGLSTVLQQRTAVEPSTPLGVDIERDELAFFPLLYWPVSLTQRPPSDRAVEKLNAYLRGGGTILFDTREQAQLTFDPFGTGGAPTAKLRQLLQQLDIPALMPVPTDHVLTKSFYLLKDFPGRWAGGTVWVERRGGRHNDGVSTVIIGSNDWASAWAVDPNGNAMYPTVPGGERQREFAYRFGVNWVMYALTGNYKTDQVHAPAIIERLGQ
jgi:hypothetical protein